MPLQSDNPLFIAGVVAALGILLIIIWLLTVIIRLVFDRDPGFPAWQPPYRINPMLNPDTNAGRRQLWQQQAQSDALPMPCEPASYFARKVLVGSDGTKLRGWQVTDIRLSQYDAYGRLARTQSIASSRAVKKLNKAIKKGEKWTPTQIQNSALSSTKMLMKDFGKRLKRTPTLPISMDIRLRGMRGEVRLFFELYECEVSHWLLLDAWEPDMSVVGNSLQENYTYAFTGQRQGETLKQFRARLQDEIRRTLTSMLTRPQSIASPDSAVVPAVPPEIPPPSPETTPMPPVPTMIADDTAQIKAVKPSEMVTEPLLEIEDQPPVSESLTEPVDLDGETVPGTPNDLPE